MRLLLPSWRRMTHTFVHEKKAQKQQRASLSGAGSKTGTPHKLPDEQKRQGINVARDLLSHFKPDGTERVTGVTTEA